MSSFRGSRAFLGATLVLGLFCAACASPTVTAGVPAGNPTASTPEAAKAPPSAGPVIRNQTKPHPTVRAGQGGFSKAKPAQYADGVSVTVVPIKHGVEKGPGPGVFAGRANTTFSISLTNRSPRPIDVTQVVVTTTYGSPARQASPVYEDQAVSDFAGIVRSG